MSTFAALAATAALGIITGRLSAGLTIHRLHATITDLRDQNDTLDQLLRMANHLNRHDRLTGLPNRSAAAAEFLLHELLGRPTIVALIDLDRFKHINDTYGHHVGDDLLRTVAERLAHAADTTGGSAARLAGDEFLLLLPAADDRDGDGDGDGDPAIPVAAALALLAQPATLATDDGEITVHPSASAGITVYDGTYGTFDTMLHHADIALFHAKQHRGTYRTYHPDLRMPRNTRRHGPRRRDQRPTTIPGGEVAS